MAARKRSDGPSRHRTRATPPPSSSRSRPREQPLGRRPFHPSDPAATQAATMPATTISTVRPGGPAEPGFRPTGLRSEGWKRASNLAAGHQPGEMLERPVERRLGVRRKAAAGQLPRAEVIADSYRSTCPCGNRGHRYTCRASRFLVFLQSMAVSRRPFYRKSRYYKRASAACGPRPSLPRWDAVSDHAPRLDHRFSAPAGRPGGPKIGGVGAHREQAWLRAPIAFAAQPSNIRGWD